MGGLATKSLVLDPGSAPASVEDGEMWYDSGLNTFRVRENGVTRDMAPPAVAGTEIGSLARTASAATNSQSFVDALSGGSVVPPLNATYFAMFEGEILESGPGLDIGIAVDGVVVTDSIRSYDALLGSFMTTTILAGLLTSNNVEAVFRRWAGGNPSSTVELGRRRLTIIQKA